MTRWFTDPCTPDRAAERLSHEDPDNSGLCIHCSALLRPMRYDVEDAEESGERIPNEVRHYVESMERLRARRDPESGTQS